MPHIVFIHLDLGIGGAESLVLNLAKATLPTSSSDDSSSGTISIYTTHCSPSHCYDEVAPNGPLAPYVHIRGAWLPRSFKIGGTALCSALRMLYLTYTAFKENPDALFVLDVLPTGIPHLIGGNAKGVLFYCHFPDKLLTRDTVNGETSTADVPISGMQRLKSFYRWVLDSIEEYTMNYSDLIVVNSKFTMGEVRNVFPSLFLNRDGQEDVGRVKVLYPAIESSLSKANGNTTNNGNSKEKSQGTSVLGPIVSLNRFERKKNISLLLHAYGLLLEKASLGLLEIKLPPLIIAGGYDPLNIENVEHLAELRVMADQILASFDLPKSIVVSSKSDINTNEIDASIAFYPSISNEKRQSLLQSASVWCYTPHREHFGIVPLEAMDAGCPVVAINSGGPMETIVDGVTGHLVEYTPLDDNIRNNVTVRGFADAIAKILLDPVKAGEMGQAGKKRVHDLFGMETFRKRWWELLDETHRRGHERCSRRNIPYPRITYTLVRCLFELFVAILFAAALTWILKTVGLIEEDKGIVGTIRLHYLKLTGGEEL